MSMLGHAETMDRDQIGFDMAVWCSLFQVSFADQIGEAVQAIMP